MFQLKFTDAAKDGVQDAAEYYNGQLKGLGKRFKNDVKAELDRLKQNPFTHSVRYGEVRLAALNKFPYSIHYTIQDHDIIIYLVISDFRNPSLYWVKSDGK